MDLIDPTIDGGGIELLDDFGSSEDHPAKDKVVPIGLAKKDPRKIDSANKGTTLYDGIAIREQHYMTSDDPFEPIDSIIKGKGGKKITEEDQVL